MTLDKVVALSLESLSESLISIEKSLYQLSEHFTGKKDSSDLTDDPNNVAKNPHYTVREEAIRNNPLLFKPPQVFSGRTNLADGWVGEMKTYIHFHDFDEKDAMLIIPVHLVGVARVWYDKYILEKPFDTSEEMYTAILKNFSPLHQNLAKEKT